MSSPISALGTSLGIGAAAVLAPAVSAQTVTFELIDLAFSANDMSPDGRYIVGETDINGDFFPDGTYILDTVTDTMTVLPGPGWEANAVSDDGTAVLGCMPDPDDGVEVAGMWTQLTNDWTSLGFLPDALSCPSRSNGYELSGDGEVAIGLSWDGCNGLGFIWTREDGMMPLEELANGTNRASVISAHGEVIGGFAQGSFSRTPSIWDGSTHLGQLLDPPNGDALGEVYGLRDDGSVLLGAWNPGALPAGQAVMWADPNAAPQVLGAGSLIPGWEGIAMDIADDDTIVGFDFLLGNRRAWIQPQGTGELQELVAWIEAHGGDVPDGVTTQVCQAISTDGTQIIGHTFGNGAWRVLIDYGTCPGDCGNDDGVVDTIDFLALLAEWGQVDTPCDLNGGGVDTIDFLDLLAQWGVCP